MHIFQAKKEAEVTRQKKWEEEFERQQEKLRQEAAEELKVWFHFVLINICMPGGKSIRVNAFAL